MDRPKKSMDRSMENSRILPKLEAVKLIFSGGEKIEFNDFAKF